MEIYVIIMIFLLFFSLVNSKYDILTFPISAFFLGFIGFFRSETVGTDIRVYSCNLEYITFDPNTWDRCTPFESGFNYIMAFFKEYISNEPMLFFGCIFLITLISFLFFFKRESFRPMLSLLFFVIFMYYLITFNIMRQYLGLSFFCLIYPFIKNRNIIYLILSIFFVSFTFHSSLFILLIFILFRFKPIIHFFFKKTNIYILIISCYSLFLLKSPLFNLVTNITFLPDRYLMYIRAAVRSDFDTTASIITVTSHSLFSLYVVKMSPNTNNIYLFVYVFGIVIMNLLCAINPMFDRVSSTCMFFSVIYFAFLWYNIKNISYLYLFRFAVCLYGSALFINALIKNFNEVVPYSLRIF